MSLSICPWETHQICLFFYFFIYYNTVIYSILCVFQLLRVDVSVLDVESTKMDSALKVCFSPSALSHLLVTTSANKILWLNSNTGRLLREVRQTCGASLFVRFFLFCFLLHDYIYGYMYIGIWGAQGSVHLFVRQWRWTLPAHCRTQCSEGLGLQHETGY